MQRASPNTDLTSEETSSSAFLESELTPMKIAAGVLRLGSMVSSGRPRRTLTPPLAEAVPVADAVPPLPDPAPTIRTSIS